MEPGAFPAQLRCPDCETQSLRPHGFYRRYVDGRWMRIRRGRCPACGVTHAVLPEDVCAYRDLSLEDLATILTASEPSVAARAVGDLSVESVRRARRWRREAMGELARQAERILPEARAPAPWWQRALGAFGDLVAWRHWQWQQTGHFVTGLLGLFRHGRPPWVVARSLT